MLAGHGFHEIGWKDSHEFIRCAEQREGIQCLHGLYLWTFRQPRAWMSRRGEGMSERVLWLRLCVTGPTPECGEIVGLRIVDRQAHRTLFDAFFHPVREDGWKSVPAGGANVNLANRLPLSIYVEGIERILSGATLLRGEHVARSVMAERHKRLASGIAVPTRAGNRACRPIPVG